MIIRPWKQRKSYIELRGFFALFVWACYFMSNMLFSDCAIYRLHSKYKLKNISQCDFPTRELLIIPKVFVDVATVQYTHDYFNLIVEKFYVSCTITRNLAVSNRYLNPPFCQISAGYCIWCLKEVIFVPSTVVFLHEIISNTVASADSTKMRIETFLIL